MKLINRFAVVSRLFSGSFCLILIAVGAVSAAENLSQEARLKNLSSLPVEYVIKKISDSEPSAIASFTPTYFKKRNLELVQQYCKKEIEPIRIVTGYMNENPEESFPIDKLMALQIKHMKVYSPISANQVPFSIEIGMEVGKDLPDCQTRGDQKPLPQINLHVRGVLLLQPSSQLAVGADSNQLNVKVQIQQVSYSDSDNLFKLAREMSQMSPAAVRKFVEDLRSKASGTQSGTPDPTAMWELFLTESIFTNSGTTPETFPSVAGPIFSFANHKMVRILIYGFFSDFLNGKVEGGAAVANEIQNWISSQSAESRANNSPRLP